jgi:hypothetical protein
MYKIMGGGSIAKRDGRTWGGWSRGTGGDSSRSRT